MSEEENKILLEGWQENIADLFHEADNTVGSQRYIDIQSFDSGGEKEIFTAYDQVTQRTIALARPVKKDYRNFLREARLTASLDHPSIINIYEISEEPEDTYFTMKLVDGTSLVHAVNKNSTRELLTVFLTICDALSYAHNMNIVHLDLKPENILVGHFGDTQIIDWGLAQRLNEKENKICRSGTPGFMAPEQSSKITAVDHRADIFALGAVLKFILESKDGSQNLHEQTLKKRLSSVARKSMAQSPKSRYQNVTELKKEINLFLDGYATMAEKASYLQNFNFLYKRNKKSFKLVAVFLLTLATLSSYFLNNINERKAEAKHAENAAKKAQSIAVQEERKALAAKEIAKQAQESSKVAEVKAQKATEIANQAKEEASNASKRAAQEKHYASIMLADISKMINELIKVSDFETKKALQGILTKARKSNTQGNLSLLIAIKKSLLQNNPEDKESWARLGDLYVTAYDFQRAAESYIKAEDKDSLEILKHIKPLVNKGIDFQTTDPKIILGLFQNNNNSERWRSILYHILKLKATVQGVGSQYLKILSLYLDRFATEPQAINYSFKGNRLSLEIVKNMDSRSLVELARLHIKYEYFKLYRFNYDDLKPHLTDYKIALSKVKAKTIDISQAQDVPLKGILINEFIKKVIIDNRLSLENINKLKEKFEVYDTQGKQL